MGGVDFGGDAFGVIAVQVGDGDAVAGIRQAFAEKRAQGLSATDNDGCLCGHDGILYLMGFDGEAAAVLQGVCGQVAEQVHGAWQFGFFCAVEVNGDVAE